MTVAKLTALGDKRLKEAGIADHKTDAYIFLEEVLEKNRTYILSNADETVNEDICGRYISYIAKREKRVPLQYILGKADFMGLEFYVNQDVLIPRFDTEFVTEELMINTDDGMRVLDLCTGSGCILLSLMCYKNDIEGVGCDISAGALSVAEKNMNKLISDGRLNGRASFVQSDLFENINGTFDRLVSNPPYIRSSDIETLMTEVKDFEPKTALDGGSDGLDLYRRIAKEAYSYLNPEGKIVLEIGFDQGEEVSRIFRENGYRNVEVKKDYSGNERVMICSNR